MQKLYYPTAYSFGHKDIGRIVLFKCEEQLALYPFMIVFNAYKKYDPEEDLLYKHLLTNELWTFHMLCKLGYDYVQILEDNDETI